jgi:hypothetical protein
MLVVTLIACCLGLGAVAPGGAVFVGVLAVPALIRTLGFTTMRRRLNRPATTTEKTLNFIASLGLMLGIVVVASIVALTVAYGFLTVGIAILMPLQLPILFKAFVLFSIGAIGFSWLGIAGWLYYHNWPY